MVKSDAIISDMGRREGLGFNQTVGIDLIRGVRAQGMKMFVYIYSTADGTRRYGGFIGAAPYWTWSGLFFLAAW